MAINQPGYISKCHFKGKSDRNLSRRCHLQFHFHIPVNIPRIFQILEVEITGPHWRSFCRSSVCLWSDRDVITRRGTWGAWGECLCSQRVYQLQTLAGFPVWNCSSNSWVPQEARNKEQDKNAQKHLIPRRSDHGEHRDFDRTVLFIREKKSL